MKLNNITIYNKNKKLKSSEVSIICRKISILIESGCEITHTLDILSQESNKKISNIFIKISNHIRNGNSITEAFEKTNLFSNFFISMITAGELSGNLDKVMSDLSDYYAQEQKLKSKIKSISIYPSILLVLSILTMLFMLIFVIPNFQVVFENNGIEPPLITKILINLSFFVKENYLFLLIGILITLLLLLYFIKTNNKVKYLTDRMKLSIPFVKNVVQLTITTRFCRTLSILIHSGVHIVDAIEISSKVIDNHVINQKLLISREHIIRGNNISYSIQKANVFSKSFISMLKVGEESGNLDNTLNTTNKFYSEELNIKMDQFMRSIEPIITIIIGIGVGIFVIGMIMPIFDAVNAI